jgi:putative membrane-bound dehydrogenase-like protein
MYWKSGRTAVVCIGALVTCLGLAHGQPSQDEKPLSNGQALSPKEELATFHLPKGLHAELVACEPNVVDPVALAFDGSGRLYVAEMIGYPNHGHARGNITSGKIKLLEDRNGDGFYETVTTFAEGLRLPSSVMPWQGGLLVAAAPDLICLEDTKGGGRADKRRTLYTGFGLENSEQLINGLQWALDNWVYGCSGINESTIHSAERPDSPAVVLRGRGIRFHPDKPGSLEPVSCGGQYGLAADDWEQWFTNTNSQHLRHIVLPEHYLKRNPDLAVKAVALDIPDHGAACKVFRLSPFEAWRVERTRRRSSGIDGRRFPASELVPGGFITSACSPHIYTADLLPEEFAGNSFICDPANNLVHRDQLVPHGATFVAKRVEPDSEFMASPDNWFRPVFLTTGPDGALYVADFYREVIETPDSLPDDIKRRINGESRGRGRIWRIVPDGFKPAKKPALDKASSQELVQHLADPNPWYRLTAQRLLVEQQDKSALPPLEKLAREGTTPQARVHALWTLEGLHSLKDDLIAQGLKDPQWQVREQSLRLSELHAGLEENVLALAGDASPRVQFQLACTLGEVKDTAIERQLASILAKNQGDPWIETAALSSCHDVAEKVLELLLEKEATAQKSLLSRLAAIVGARNRPSELSRVLTLVSQGRKTDWQVAVLEGLGEGLQHNYASSLSSLWKEPPLPLREPLEKLKPLFKQALDQALDSRQPVGVRTAALRLLGYGPFTYAVEAAPALLAPQNAAEVQIAIVRALSLHNDRKVADLLLASWGSYGPAVRREVLEAVFARPDRLTALLDAIEKKTVRAGELDPFRIDQLRRHPDRPLRKRAQLLLAAQVAPDRQKIVAGYRPALDLPADAGRGKVVFQKNCATCHRLENVGTEVGPDLLSALKTKTREGLLTDIFDPSREVDPRYINYVVTTAAGRVFTGLIASESASSVTLRRAEKAEDTILRSEIDTILATAKSLMPENLETQLNKQNVADLIAYLMSVAGQK